MRLYIGSAARCIPFHVKYYASANTSISDDEDYYLGSIHVNNGLPGDGTLTTLQKIIDTTIGTLPQGRWSELYLSRVTRDLSRLDCGTFEGRGNTEEILAQV